MLARALLQRWKGVRIHVLNKACCVRKAVRLAQEPEVRNMCAINLLLGFGSCAFALLADPPPSAYVPFSVWSTSIANGTCVSHGAIPCFVQADGTKAYYFPPGVFEVGEQFLVPERTSIIGNKSPNDLVHPTVTPDWSEQTLFLATSGVTDYHTKYCFAEDMVSTRVGFVLSSYVSVRNVSYQGVDTIRPDDNGALCGGGAFETKGCARNDCGSHVNNGGSDGVGSVHVTIENVRLNDFHFAEDRSKVGASIAGDYNCTSGDTTHNCCFCKPNGVRSTQVLS